MFLWNMTLDKTSSVPLLNTYKCLCMDGLSYDVGMSQISHTVYDPDQTGLNSRRCKHFFYSKAPVPVFAFCSWGCVLHCLHLLLVMDVLHGINKWHFFCAIAELCKSLVLQEDFLSWGYFSMSKTLIYRCSCGQVLG